ncbi:MAG: hypothetical protein ABIG69_11490 [Bacteroidota bacterium]
MNENEKPKIDRTESEVNVEPLVRLQADTLKQTCGACPAQWEGKIKDGRMFYIRYRWGYLALEISDKATDDVMGAVGGAELFGEQIGDEFDGFLDELKMKNLTSKVMDWQGLST